MNIMTLKQNISVYKFNAFLPKHAKIRFFVFFIPLLPFYSYPHMYVTSYVCIIHTFGYTPPQMNHLISLYTLPFKATSYMRPPKIVCCACFTHKYIHLSF